MNPLSIECDVHFTKHGRGRKELEAGTEPPPPVPRLARSAASVVFATAQPLLSPPMMFSAGTRPSSMKTSLKSARPVISRSGRTSTPRWRISNAK